MSLVKDLPHLMYILVPRKVCSRDRWTELDTTRILSGHNCSSRRFGDFCLYNCRIGIRGQMFPTVIRSCEDTTLAKLPPKRRFKAEERWIPNIFQLRERMRSRSVEAKLCQTGIALCQASRTGSQIPCKGQRIKSDAL